MRLPIAGEGWPSSSRLRAGGLFALLHWRAAAVLALALALFVSWFFRDPQREIPADPAAIVSPADGRVIEIVTLPGGGSRISIFLSIFNVHVNRSPVAGDVVDVSRRPGKFLAAWKHEASSDTPEPQSRCARRAGRAFRADHRADRPRIVCHLAPGARVGRRRAPA
jgi:phosphatidylserine decarboxylase